MILLNCNICLHYPRCLDSSRILNLKSPTAFQARSQGGAFRGQAPPVKILPIFLRGSNCAHGALETEEIRTELKKSPAFVLIIAQYNSQSDSDYMYFSVNMKENEY